LSTGNCILALTGPSGVGKTTISQLLVECVDDHLHKAPIITTRAPKKYDGNEYLYVTMERFSDWQRNGELAAKTMLPPKNERRWYGYRRKDIDTIQKEGKIPVVITEMSLLQDLVAYYGRDSILSYGLLPPGESREIILSVLLHRLRDRGRDSEESIRSRLKNAEHDLAFFTQRADLFDHILVNHHIDQVASRIKEHVTQSIRQ